MKTQADSWTDLLAQLYRKWQILGHQYREHPEGYGTGLKHVLLFFWHTKYPLWYFLKTVLAHPQHYQATCLIYLKKLGQAIGNQPFPELEKQAPRTLRSSLWDDYRIFHGLKIGYLLTVEFIHTLIALTPMSDLNRAKVRLISQWYISACSPANFYFANPTVIETTWRTKGLNWLQGLNYGLADCISNQGYIQFNKNDGKSQTIGIDIAATPGYVVYQNELLQLLYYQPTGPKRSVPILIVPSWINKYYIFDLKAKNSIVRWLTKQGFSVFVISWVNPDENQAHFAPVHYIHQGIIQSIDYIQKTLQTEHLHTLGYCLGGTLLACALAWQKAKYPKFKVTSLTLIASLLDFSQGGALALLTADRELQWYQKLMQKHALWDGRRLASIFNLLDPNEYIWPYWVNRYGQAKPVPALDALIWSADLTHSTNAMQHFYLFDLYRYNRLAAQQLQIDKQLLSLKHLNLPTFGVCFTEDQIAPPQASLASFKHLPKQAQVVMAGGGHFSGLVNLPRASQKPLKLRQPIYHLEKSNSWWPLWEGWLTDLEQPITTPLGAIPITTQMPAPGDYCLKSIVPECCHY